MGMPSRRRVSAALMSARMTGMPMSLVQTTKSRVIFSTEIAAVMMSAAVT